MSVFHLSWSCSGRLAGSGHSEIQFSDFFTSPISNGQGPPEELCNDRDDRTHHAAREKVTARGIRSDSVTP